MNSELNSKIKLITITNLIIFFLATTANADPVVAGEIIPPASATLIEDPDMIKKIGVGRDGDPVWCYSQDANAIIITAPQREREKCELKLKQQKEKLEALHKLQVDTLQLELDSITKKHESLMLVKDREIEDLTKAALERPNDYSMWWATGGLVVGVLSTLAIVFAVK
jgi:hypothetical protein